MPFNAPAPVPNLAAERSIPCQEKRAGNVTYPQPCSNRWNCVLNFARESLSPNARPDDFGWKICTVRHQRHPSGFHVCRYCIAAAEDERWFRLATTYFRNKPPAAAEDNRSRYYLTRLCRLCEHREETLLSQLLPSNAPHAAANPMPPQNLPTQIARNFMAEWPSNRCTCEKKSLYLGIRCLPHRRDFWDFRRSRIAREKTRNKNYLINTSRLGGQRVNATEGKMDDRRRDGLWRACRCGNDPVATTAEATVMQCMACEGIVHFDIIQGGPQPAFGTPPTPAPTPREVSENSLSTPRLFSITGRWGNHRQAND